jgi:hypothetical protein
MRLVGSSRARSVDGVGFHSVRGASFFQLGIFAVVAGAITAAVAYLIPWLPVSASREAGRITFIFWFVEWISIVIFAFVVAVLAYAVW